MRPLQAYPEKGGSGVTVHITGENIHDNQNRLYWPRNAVKRLRAKIPYEARCGDTEMINELETLSITGEDIHDIAEYEAFSVRALGPLRPIGHFGIHINCDYVTDASITAFSSDINCVDLGRYGPFRKEGGSVGVVSVAAGSLV